MNLRRIGLFFMVCGCLGAQTLSNATLNGKYFVRHVEFTTDGSNNVTDARSITGTITFTGTGQYTIAAQQVIGTGSPAAFSFTGSYAVNSSGTLALSNPQKVLTNINARYTAEAIIGSSTEATDNTFDFFVAIPAPTATANAASIKGNYFVTDFELTSALTSQVRNSSFLAAFDGVSTFGTVTPTGHAANVTSGNIITQTVTGTAYTVNADGTGTLSIPLPPGTTNASALVSASKSLQLSASGNILLGATPGLHDILIGVKSFSGTGSGSSLTQRTWGAALRVDSSAGGQIYTGSTVTIANANTIFARRLRELSYSSPFDYTGTQPYNVAADGTGTMGNSNIFLGTGGNMLTYVNTSPLDPTGYEIGLWSAIPALTGSGVWINPQGVVNAAGNAPAGDYISPGEFIAIYGSGLAASTMVAAPPYPNTLNGVSITMNGIAAPLYLVSTGQINALVPYGVTGNNVSIVVTNGTTASNTVTVPLAKTSPGIFSNDTSGIGQGAVLHLDYTAVTQASPAKKGEILQVYLTGLGAVTSPVKDGTAPTGADAAVAPIGVLISGVPATNVLYGGLVALYPGLYQINFTVPSNLTVTGLLPLAVVTPDAFHDQISFWVQ